MKIDKFVTKKKPHIYGYEVQTKYVKIMISEKKSIILDVSQLVFVKLCPKLKFLSKQISLTY